MTADIDNQVAQTTTPVEEVKCDVKEKKVEEVKCDVKEEKVEIDLQDKAVEENGTAENEPLVTKEEELPVPKKNVHKQDYEEGMVYLYQSIRSPLLPSIDPSCLKLETWLRLAGVKYENVDHGMKFKSKKGQLPFIEFDGEEYSDISSIVNALNANLDDNLTVQQHCVSSFAIAMLENHFSWVLKAWRSNNPVEMLKAYQIDLQKVTGKTWPNIILNLVYKHQQKKQAQSVVAHGIGVHTPEEIESFGQDDLQVLSDLLGEQEYFFGETPTSLDVVTFAHLSQLLYMDSEVQCGLRDGLKEKCPNLVVMCDRLKEKTFADWEELLKPKVEEPETKEVTEEKADGEKETPEEKADVQKETPEEKADVQKETPEEKADVEKETPEKDDKQLKKDIKNKEKKEKEDKKKKEKEEKEDKKKKEKEEKKKEQKEKKEKKDAKKEDEKKEGDDKKEDEKKEDGDKKDEVKKDNGEKKEDGDKKDVEKDADNNEEIKMIDEEKKEDPTNEDEKKDEEKPVDNKENADESVLSQENTQL